MQTYHKLVRDKIPEIIEKNGGTYTAHTADDAEYWEKLKEKLREEVGEFITDESLEELADLFEVIDAIIAFKRFDRRAIEILQDNKRKKRGGFERRIILEES